MRARWLVVAVLVAGCAGHGEGEWRPIHHAIQERKQVELAMADVSARQRARTLNPQQYTVLLTLYSDWAVSQAELTAATERWQKTPGAAADEQLKVALELTQRSGDAFLRAARR